MNTQDLINRLIDRGSFDLNSDAEFMTLPRREKDRVRMIVRFNLLQEA
jgi:hypothetical protein